MYQQKKEEEIESRRFKKLRDLRLDAEFTFY